MEYPKYKREEKLSAKLSKEDIILLKKLRKDGYTFEKLSIKFGISQPHAYFLCMSKEKLLIRLEQMKKYMNLTKKIKKKTIVIK